MSSTRRVVVSVAWRHSGIVATAGAAFGFIAIGTAISAARRLTRVVSVLTIATARKLGILASAPTRRQEALTEREHTGRGERPSGKIMRRTQRSQPTKAPTTRAHASTREGGREQGTDRLPRARARSLQHQTKLQNLIPYWPRSDTCAGGRRCSGCSARHRRHR